MYNMYIYTYISCKSSFTRSHASLYLIGRNKESQEEPQNVFLFLYNSTATVYIILNQYYINQKSHFSFEKNGLE